MFLINCLLDIVLIFVMKYSILVTSWELKGLCYIPQSLECVALPSYFSAQQPQDVQLYPDRYNAIHVFLPPSQKVLSIQCLYRKKDENPIYQHQEQ